MVQNNKVLTVSYGTFSCTLEGFDDSFDTMKAIAEYFRDLAADDRYFGAEPPQPDADMLARIAQREISRQVEARQDATKGIVLRAGEPAAGVAVAEPVIEAAPPPAAEEPAVADAIEVEDTPEADETVAAEPVAPTPVEDAPAPQPLEAEPHDAPDEISEVAPDAEVAAEKPEVADTADEPLIETVPEAPAEPEIEEPVAESAPAEFEEDETLESVAAAIAEPQEDEVALAEPVEEIQKAAPEIVPAADSIAAKLQRIRAVVSQNEQAAEAEETYTEDEHAEDMIAEAARDVTAALEADAEETAPDVDENAALFADLDAEYDDEDDGADIDLSNIIETPAVDRDADKPARVVKVKRADLDAAIAAGDIEEVEEDLPEPQGSLSPEDEADLLRELAEVEAELSGALDIEEEPKSEPLILQADDALDPDEEDELTSARPQATEDVTRLMDKADEKLDDPDLSGDRDTYSHLRAAVAAAEAERSAGGTVGTRISDDDYREDLASVVRPRRPAAAGSSQRPRGEDRPAPLKLVAEQRIDTPRDNDSRGPVRPRRVANLVQDETETASQGSFAEFAAEHGAVALPDLLEAAAAYMSFVEGREQFSRPQLMNKVRQLDSQEFNREDGLRSFGQLLREGKIEKTGGGRFTASGQINFRPGDRAVG